MKGCFPEIEFGKKKGTTEDGSPSLSEHIVWFRHKYKKQNSLIGYGQNALFSL